MCKKRFPSWPQLEAASKDSAYLEEKIRVVPSAERAGTEGQLTSDKLRGKKSSEVKSYYNG